MPLVVEIGPASGALTERLCSRAPIGWWPIELDPDLAALLRQRLPDPRLEIVTADVLETDLNQWGPAVAAGNLPYYISTAILSRALAPGSLLERGVFLVQKEVADRIAALPGSRAYGALSVEMQLHAGVQVLFGVHPAAFHPPPKVDSALIGFHGAVPRGGTRPRFGRRVPEIRSSLLSPETKNDPQQPGGRL